MPTLTTKELTALEEQLGSEQNLVKKYQALASICSDATVRQRLESAAAKHQEHVNSLLPFLN